MAKIDITKIEGYATMTDAQKVAAFEAYELPAPDYTGYVKKETFDKTASEAAAWKRKHNELLSDEEKKKQEQEDKYTALEKELADLRTAKVISEYTAKYIAQGYDEKLAAETAKAYADGDAAKVFENNEKFLAEYAKKLKAEALKSTPRPQGGTGNTDEDYSKKIEAAQANSDFAAAAYYTRLQAEAEVKSKQG